jgi:uncharacterized membrane protein YeaQ/YmgE (transglycosylase-associated protein family)
MNFAIWLMIGGILGWLASIVMKTDSEQGLFLNVVGGIIGALTAGYFLAPIFGTGAINSNDFSVAGLAMSFVGALAMLAIVTMYQRRQ